VPRLPLPRRRLPGHRLPVAVLLLALVATGSTSGASLYHIRSGDTLSGIAQHFHMSIRRLVAFNHLPGAGTTIYAGAYLRIPTGPPRPAATRPATTGAPETISRTVVSTYIVKPGDTLIGVAGRFRANARRIAAYSHLPHSLMIIIGQRLRIPRDVRIQVGGGAPSHGAYQIRGPAPSSATVAAVLRATARRWGVDQRLVLAIGWQESGFNQRWVSSTGAVGAMQVEPYTGAFVAKFVVRRPLDLYKIGDNATAGVALLAVLLRETHGNETKAVAGYYQGLASVQSRGMYDDTRRYVASVLALRNRF
jgi:N-acetylmuramoyl-L-alanine amidase